MIFHPLANIGDKAATASPVDEHVRARHLASQPFSAGADINTTLGYVKEGEERADRFLGSVPFAKSEGKLACTYDEDE